MDGLETLIALGALTRTLVDVLKKGSLSLVSNPETQSRIESSELWLIAAILLGTIIVWFSGVSAFPVGTFPTESYARVITGLAVGAGGSLIHDLVKRKRTPS